MARTPKAQPNYKALSFLILVVILVIYHLFSGGTTETKPIPTGGEIYVHFINVGQGDAALVQTKDGNLLIDAGPSDSAEAIMAYLDACGVRDLQYAIFTHAHADHIGGAPRLLDAYSFANVVLPDAVSTSYTFEKTLDAIENNGCTVIEGKAGVSFALGEVQVELLAPIEGSDIQKDDLNNASIVSKITYGEVSFLFTGDAESLSEKVMLERDASLLDSDVLKVGHHGSSSSSTADFLLAVTPEVAIVSAGLYNEYGHPHGEVVSRLSDMGASLYRTDKSGNIVVCTDGITYNVQTEK